ncbi:helix-turn-helix domain-containing protein [Limosilactobacillus albertensis]|uniref:Helix-turn-helix transcriptional regulator n=1 Tax=Limosilactobacillus albertensis TaxID=2759752 RepID=A0A839GXN1_9LACO|nr:helix-turn-helix transcriptional regulator [Limosilactobacillus albertensis]MBB1122471.1 helix-turn-helix transcriptional regulator [Limosilactobacillus albertensis]MCD7121354.1 helix-turn-helix domain-containing protein [Limosilactobacillus albertensis]
MKFADKMKLYRHQHNWTQQEVAERLAISRKTISSWENSRSYPDIFMLVQISDLYHVSLDNLLREDHEMMDNYKEEHISNKKSDRDFRKSYLYNAVGSIFMVLKFIHVLPGYGGIFGVLIGAIIGFTIVNLYLLLSETNWNRMRTNEKISFTLAFIIILSLILTINLINPLSHIPGGSADYTSGIITGRIVGSMIVSLSLTCSFSLFPQFKERSEK